METIDTRNVQTVEIERLNERIAEQQQMLRLQDDSINNLLRSCRNKDATIDEQRAVIHVMSGGHGERIIADNEMLKDGIAAAAKNNVEAMKLIRDRGDEIKELEDEMDERINKFKRLEEMYYDSLGGLMRQDNDIDDLQEHRSELEREINSLHAGAKTRAIEIDKLHAIIDELKRMHHARTNPVDRLIELHKTIYKRNATIGEQNTRVKELEAKLVDAGRRFDHVVKFNEKLVHDTNKLFTKRDATIKELKVKLTDRERQFNELDGAIDRTRELLHVATDRVREQNDEIAKKDDWISSYSKNDKRLNQLLDELLADVRKRNKIIDGLMGRTP